MFNPDLLLLNICSLSSYKIDAIDIDYLSVSNDFKFLCFTEVWLPANFINSCIINNFNLVSYYCRNDYLHGGVGIWARDGLDINSIDMQEHCIDKHIEICGLKWMDKDGIYLILLSYRSPQNNLKLFF